MIERMELQADRPDWAALLGRGTLVGGTAFAGYKTLQGVGVSPLQAGHFRKEMSKLSTHRVIAERAVKDVYGISYADLLGDTTADFFVRFKQVRPEGKLNAIATLGEQITGYGTGYRGQSGDLFGQITGLYEDLVSQGAKPTIHTRGLESGLGQIRLQATAGGKDIRFDVSAVSPEGTMAVGANLENKYAARGVLKDFNALTGETIGADVALVRKYRESLGEILTGEVSAKDLARTMHERSIFEEARGAKSLAKTESSVLGKLRREQIVVDPFQELTAKSLQERMKRLMRMPGLGAGSAAQFAKGILNAPESLIAGGLPGAAESASAYQLLRMSEFTGAKPSTIKWADTQNFAEFKVAAVTDQEALKRVLKQRGYKIGELAAEEILLNNTGNIGIKNKLYTFNIDLQRDPTKLTHRLLKRISAETGMTIGAVAEKMRSREGLTGLDIDINEGYKNLIRRKENLETDLQMLNRMKTDRVTGARTYDRRYTLGSLDKVNEALKDYGVLGYAPDTDELVKLKGGEELQNKILQMRIRDNKMSIATESHFKFAEGAKTFSGGGGAKWTVKNLVNVEDILEQMEWQAASQTTGRLATEAELKASGVKGMFGGTQMISTEAPIRIKKGTIAGREAMSAIMSYSTNLAQDVDIAQVEKLRRLKELGIEQGKFVGTSLTGEQIIGKIRGWHNNAPLEQVFGGTSYMTADVSRTLLAADIHTVQSGFGGLASMSERAAYNMQALGLKEFGAEVMGRRALAFDPMSQFRELQTGEALLKDTAAKGRRVEQFADPNILKASFQTDLEARRRYIGTERATVGLGKNLAGVEKVNIYAADTLAPYIGKQIGGDMTELDRTTRNLISSVARGEGETQQLAAAEKYKAAMKSVQGGVESNLFKGKVTRSMYGQATSALEGMDTAAKELGKAMGMEGMTAPLIAMSKHDIRRQLGKDAIKRAAQGELWGMITREPVEGIHSTIPVNIGIAEEYGAKNARKGMIYLSGEDQANSMLRKSLFVDFDKDPLHVIAATTDKSTAEIRDFMMDEKNLMGRQYKESLARMSAFNLKSRAPRDISAIDEMMRVDVNTATKQLEKASIGIFSNEFKNIHIGLREQLVEKMSRAGAEKFYLGEDLSHLYLENILKAKHQSAEAIVKGEAQKVLDILQSKDSASLQKRTVAMQGAFDEMVFGGEEGRRIGEQVRQLDAGQDVSADLATRMGYADELADAASDSAQQARIAKESQIIQRATKQAQAHRAISSFGNVENVLQAHDVGEELQRTASYSAGIASKGLSTRSKLLSTLDDVKAVTSKIMSKGLKNVGKYAILPTAAIGLAASLVTSPRTLTPVEKTGPDHEKDYEGLGEVSAPKTVYDIPPSNITAAQIRGQVSRDTNFEYLSQMGNKSGANIRISDHRNHANKYTVEEMIRKGY